MATYRVIRGYLEAEQSDLSYSQFTIDWIERKLEEWDTREETRSLVDDATIAPAICYEADNVMSVMRTGLKDFVFFAKLRTLAGDYSAGEHNSRIVEEWAKDKGAGVRP